MTEHVLQFDPTAVPQEQSWDCGPASTQVVLNTRGVIKAENQLIDQIGTTEDGTPSVLSILPVLRSYLPAANYQATLLDNEDVPTPAQKDQLWADITRSIDGGYGVIMNWEAPTSNYPRGVKGSPNPSYGGGTVFHYVTAMGYDDAPGARAIYVADPGFRPFVYWCSFDQVATLIPPKGYLTAAPAVVAPPLPPPPAVDPAVQALYDAVPVIDMPTSARLLPLIRQGLADSQCTNPKRIAMWLAQIGEESGGFVYTEEIAKDGSYAPYIGRTWIQITWQSNYAAFGQWCHDQGLLDDPNQFVNNPSSLADAQWAGIGPAWYWTVARPQINSLCDNSDIVGVTLAINGGTNGLQDRTNRYNQALSVGDRLLALIPPPSTEGLFMALTDQQQADLYNAIMAIAAVVADNNTQLRGPNQQGWPQLGKNASGQNLTLVDAIGTLTNPAPKKD